jgi:hypothetical protein
VGRRRRRRADRKAVRGLPVDVPQRASPAGTLTATPTALRVVFYGLGSRSEPNEPKSFIWKEHARQQRSSGYGIASANTGSSSSCTSSRTASDGISRASLCERDVYSQPRKRHWSTRMRTRTSGMRTGSKSASGDQLVSARLRSLRPPHRGHQHAIPVIQTPPADLTRAFRPARDRRPRLKVPSRIARPVQRLRSLNRLILAVKLGCATHVQPIDAQAQRQILEAP